MSIFDFGKSPRKRIEAVLLGRVALDDEEPSIRSACRLYIYQGAVEILSLGSKEARLRALGKLPPKIKPHVEAEALRIWKLRKDEIYSDHEHAV